MVRKFTLRTALAVAHLYEEFTGDASLRKALQGGDPLVIEQTRRARALALDNRPEYTPRYRRADRTTGLLEEAEDALRSAGFACHPDLGVAAYQTLDAAALAARHAAERQGLPFDTARYWTEALAAA